MIGARISGTHTEALNPMRPAPVAFVPGAPSSDLGDVSLVTPSTRPKAGDPSPRLEPRYRFAVHRPGSPVASLRSHGKSCRGMVAGRAVALMVIADVFDYTREEAAFPRGFENGDPVAVILMTPQHSESDPQGRRCDLRRGPAPLGATSKEIDCT